VAEGYKDFTDGSRLYAAEIEEYAQNQAVMRFASAAARDTALATVKTEGMLAYLLDANTLTVYTGSAWSTIGPVHGAWGTWTPTITQGVGVGVSLNEASFFRAGRFASFSATLTCTSAGTAANTIVVGGFPFSMKTYSTYSILGVGGVLDASAAMSYDGNLRWAGATSFTIQNGATPVDGLLGSSGFTASLTTSDILSVHGHCELAADA
jgi:hypothetical protein